MNLPNKKLKRVVYIYDDDEMYAIDGAAVENYETNLSSASMLGVVHGQRFGSVDWSDVDIPKKLHKLAKIGAKKLTVQCSCGGMEFVQFLSFEKMEDDAKDEYEELYVTITNRMHLWRDKWEAIKSIITDGEFTNFGSIISRESVEEIIKYLQNILEYWTSLEDDDIDTAHTL